MWSVSTPHDHQLDKQAQAHGLARLPNKAKPRSGTPKPNLHRSWGWRNNQCRISAPVMLFAGIRLNFLVKGTHEDL